MKQNSINHYVELIENAHRNIEWLNREYINCDTIEQRLAVISALQITNKALQFYLLELERIDKIEN